MRGEEVAVENGKNLLVEHLLGILMEYIIYMHNIYIYNIYI